MKHLLPLLCGLILCLWSVELSAQCTPVYLFPSTTATNASCNGTLDGCLTVNPVGALGRVGYQWSTGATTGPTLCGLGAGTYSITVTDTLSGTGSVDTAYLETFDGATGWTLNVSTGTNGANNNSWVINSNEAGNPVGSCGSTGGPDQTLHVTSTFNVSGGAAYNAGGLCRPPLVSFCVETNRRAESPAFSTVGLSNLTLAFDFIANGDGTIDNASVLYNDGTGWQVLTASIKSNTCSGGQGEWTRYTATLPASCNNNATVQVGLNWTNNDDGVGTDPSVAINNILVTAGGAGNGQVCSAVVRGVVGQPFTLVTSVDSVGSAICAGSSNGLIDLAVSGGTAPYTYLWSNSMTTQDISGLTEGTYTVTVTDVGGCTVFDTVVVPLQGNIDVIIDSTDQILCFGDNTGAIYTTVTSDTSGFDCSSPVVALNEIMYRPSVRNGQDPNTGEYIELIGPPGTNIGCYVLTDGDWTITIPPGTTIPADGYFTIGNDIIWGAGTFDLDAENCGCFTEGTGGQSLLILTDGGEYVALFDASGSFLQGLMYGSPSAGNTPNGNTMTTIGTAGCVSSVTVPTAASFETAIGGLASNTSLIRNPDGNGTWSPQVGGSLNLCNSAAAGNNNISAITYLWSNGDTTQNITGLTAGTYTVTVTNRFGCTDTASFTLNQPSAITATATTTDVVCMGDSTGSIDLTVNGGTAPYTYLWSNGTTTQDLTNIPAGFYCGTITDANGCTINLCDSITEGFLDIPVDTLYICPGDSVPLQVNTSLAQIIWTPSATLSNDTLFNPLASPTTTTTYIVRPRGSRGRNLIVNGDFSQGNVGFTSSYANYAGGIGNGYIIDTNAQIYNSQHSGFDHTTGSGNYLIADAAPGTVDVWCQTVAVTPNTLYDFSMWVNNIIRPTSNVADPTLEVTINGIVLTNTGSIPEVPDVWVNRTAQWSSGVNTSATICIRAVAVSGQGHDFGLDDISFAPVNACSMSDSVVVVVQNINLSNATIINPACFGDSTGSINTNTTGLTYQWSTGDTTAALSNLPSGTYSVIASNSSSCADTLTVTLTQPDSLYIQLDSVVGIGCFNRDPGAIFITGIDGTGPYTYLWSTGDTAQNLTGVLAGNYCLTLTDANGCTATLCDSVPDVYTINLADDTLALCLGASATLAATITPNYTGAVQWTPTTGLASPTAATTLATPTTTTTYVVSIPGQRCPILDSVLVIVEQADVQLATTNTPPCNGDTTGSITTVATMTNLSYLWSTGDTTADLTNIGAGTYTLVATGPQGFCADTLVVTLNQPDSLLLSLGVVTPVTCRSGNDGAIGTTTVTGGTPTYTYLWSNSATTTSLSNLTAGFYTLTVTDANGCTTSQSATVTQPTDSVNITYNATPVSCNGTNDGSITAIAVNGIPAYTYQWGIGTGNQTGATATNLATGTYTVTATDANGCTATAIGLFVPQNTPVDTNSVALLVTKNIVDCDLLPTGAAQINTPNTYTYLWSNGNTTQSVANLPTGPFTVTISTGTCTLVVGDDIQTPFVPTINPFIDASGNTSSSTSPGRALDLGSGNDERPTVQYNWTATPSTSLVVGDPSLPLTTVSATDPGTYALLLTATALDSNGCQDTGTVYLTIEAEFLGMPTAFTPNNDDVNDIYRPIGLTEGNVRSFKIYNRWGQLIYDGDNLPGGGWDGTFQGVPQPMEAYIFLLEYQLEPSRPVEVRRGEFFLIR